MTSLIKIVVKIEKPTHRAMNNYMKTFTGLLLLITAVMSYGQTSISDQYNKADSLTQKNNFIESYKILRELESKVDKSDTLYAYILWYYTTSVTLLEKEERLNERWENALKYSLEALVVVEKGEQYFNDEYCTEVLDV
jgi:predicted RND superfamily exporter protein